ncbi:MAG TPA: methionyl-tRNA formyltransferase [Candidatus Bipolaricaulota bacterium]|nr:methionyl-tRNA formyltransferase [Candidatus Bipolaricaulota bacterium]
MNNIKVIFFGTPDFAIPTLRALAENFSIEAVVTQPDKPKGRNKILSASPIKEYAQARDFLILQPEKLDKNFIDELKKIQPDLGVVVAFGKILPKEILDLPKHGCLNIHASLLPKYRGAAPIQAALLNGDKETGVTIMKMDAGLDTGDIISQNKSQIKKSDNFQTLHDRLSVLGAELMSKTISNYLSGQINPQKQDDSAASYFPTITKGQGRIVWQSSAEHIFNQIRAFTPWPGAFTFFNDKKLDILSADVAECGEAKPVGSVFKHDDRILVQCENGCLEIKKVKLEGKKEVGANDFINGHPEFIGLKLQ